MRLALDAEMFFVPLVELLGVFRFEEDTTNAGYAFHRAPLVQGCNQVAEV
jgi:hypothetical protein